MDNISDDTNLPAGTVTDATNGVFTDGAFLGRPQYDVGVPGDAAWVKHTSKGLAYVLDGNLIIDGFSTPLMDASHVAYIELPDALLVATRRDSLLFTAASRPPSEFLIPAPVCSVTNTLITPIADGEVVPAERQDDRAFVAVAAAFKDSTGREGPMSYPQMTQGAASAALSVLPITGIDRFVVFAAKQDVTQMYCAGDDITVGSTAVIDDSTPLGRMGRPFLAPMILGKFTSLWRGYLLSATGRVLHFSRPLEYHITDPVADFVQFHDEITFVAGVEGGVFVGQKDSVKFLAGTDPTQWSLIALTGTPIPNSATLAEAHEFPPELVQGQTTPVAVWLSTSGFVLGLQKGAVVMPQAARIEVPKYASASTNVFRRTITAFIHTR